MFCIASLFVNIPTTTAARRVAIKGRKFMFKLDRSDLFQSNLSLSIQISLIFKVKISIFGNIFSI
jgi:hypothetical protein